MYSLSSQSAGCKVKGILDTVLCTFAKKLIHIFFFFFCSKLRIFNTNRWNIEACCKYNLIQVDIDATYLRTPIVQADNVEQE